MYQEMCEFVVIFYLFFICLFSEIKNKLYCIIFLSKGYGEEEKR